jgi:hypothetical protein
VFLPACLRLPNRHGMPHATLDRQLLHQPEEPSPRARRFDPHDDRRRNGGVEFADGLPFVLQRLLRSPRRCRDPASQSIAGSRANRTQSASSRPPSTRARRAWTPHSLRGSIRGRRRYDINVYAGELKVRPPGAPTIGLNRATPPGSSKTSVDVVRGGHGFLQSRQGQIRAPAYRPDGI